LIFSVHSNDRAILDFGFWILDENLKSKKRSRGLSIYGEKEEKIFRNSCLFLKVEVNPKSLAPKSKIE
jgi:hypothetical protein